MEQTGLNEDQFKVQHLLQRIAEITVRHESAMATGAVQLQMLTQERNGLREQVQHLASQLSELTVQNGRTDVEEETPQD